MKKRKSMSKMLYLLLSAFVVGFGVFAAVTYHTIEDVKVNGPIHEELVKLSDLQADTIAPPLFVLRPLQIAGALVRTKSPEELRATAERFAQTEKDFQERKAFWESNLEDGELKQQLREGEQVAERIFAVMNQEVLPALERQDYDAAREIIAAKIDGAFQDHRAKMDVVVEKLSAAARAKEAEAADAVASRGRILFVIGVACLVAVAALGWWILRTLVVQNAEALINSAMIEQTTFNIMFADRNFIIRYANPSSINTLRSIEKYLPIKASEIVGQCIDIFHKNPAHQRNLLDNRANLPHKAQIKVGPEVMELNVCAVNDAKGNYIGAMVSWAIITEAVWSKERDKHLMAEIYQSAMTLGSSAEELTAVSTQMAANAEETSAQANVVSAASEQVSKNVQVVSTGVEEMNSAIREIAKNATEAAHIAQQAVTTADAANSSIAKLGESSVEIGNVIKVITSIAEQTNLLALNATIEAARAGEAGKGFAVVANEVKELAKDTARATEDISRKIETIQADTNGAVESIQQISQVIAQINDISTTIAGAVEEQTATANEMGRNVSEAAKGTSEIAQNITAVAQAAQNTTQGASNSQQAASELARMASDLQKLGAQDGANNSLAV